MSLKIYYDEMKAKTIYLEIIKRLMNIDYSDDFFGIEDIFGAEWLLLDKVEREVAEGWLVKVISEKSLKGIIYKSPERGEYLYMRIRNDIFYKRRNG